MAAYKIYVTDDVSLKLSGGRHSKRADRFSCIGLVRTFLNALKSLKVATLRC